jgi:hypothetical protein
LIFRDTGRKSKRKRRRRRTRTRKQTSAPIEMRPSYLELRLQHTVLSWVLMKWAGKEGDIIRVGGYRALSTSPNCPHDRCILFFSMRTGKVIDSTFIYLMQRQKAGVMNLSVLDFLIFSCT